MALTPVNENLIKTPPSWIWYNIIKYTWRCLFMVKKRVAYSVYTKNKAVEMKLQGYSTKQVMQELNIKNRTQVETWFRWYKNGETHRFHQQVGKQYSYEKGMAELSEIDQLKLELKRKEVELEILKKYKELERKCRLKQL